MTHDLSKGDRRQTQLEEAINVGTSVIGLVGALIGTPFLIVEAFEDRGLFGVMSVYAFALSLIWLYGASAVYHALPHSKAKRVAAIADHCGVFALIAGTYTPFALGPLRPDGGWILFWIVWIIALMGIAMKVYGWMNWRWFSLTLYLVMGWIGIFWVGAAFEKIAPIGLVLILLGGLSYTAGTVFYLMKKKEYMHNVWHAFVLAGSAFHFFAVLWYS